MAKIGKVSLKIDGGWKDINIWYTQTDRFFIKREEIEPLVGTIEGPTGGYFKEDDLRIRITKIVDEYHEDKKSQRKVILYTIYASTELKMVVDQEYVGGGRSYQGYHPWIPEAVREMDRCNGSFSGVNNGRGFSLEWQVGIETDRGGVSYRRLQKDGLLGSKIHRGGAAVIDWTEQREAGFRAIDTGMQALFQKVATILGEPTELARLLDCSRMALPLPGEGELSDGNH